MPGIKSLHDKSSIPNTGQLHRKKQLVSWLGAALESQELEEVVLMASERAR